MCKVGVDVNVLCRVGVNVNVPCKVGSHIFVVFTLYFYLILSTVWLYCRQYRLCVSGRKDSDNVRSFAPEH